MEPYSSFKLKPIMHHILDQKEITQNIYIYIHITPAIILLQQKNYHPLHVHVSCFNDLKYPLLSPNFDIYLLKAQKARTQFQDH